MTEKSSFPNLLSETSEALLCKLFEVARIAAERPSGQSYHKMVELAQSVWDD